MGHQSRLGKQRRTVKARAAREGATRGALACHKCESLLFRVVSHESECVVAYFSGEPSEAQAEEAIDQHLESLGPSEYIEPRCNGYTIERVS